jgi:hypothetical protein
LITRHAKCIKNKWITQEILSWLAVNQYKFSYSQRNGLAVKWPCRWARERSSSREERDLCALVLVQSRSRMTTMVPLKSTWHKLCLIGSIMGLHALRCVQNWERNGRGTSLLGPGTPPPTGP